MHVMQASDACDASKRRMRHKQVTNMSVATDAYLDKGLRENADYPILKISGIKSRLKDVDTEESYDVYIGRVCMNESCL